MDVLSESCEPPPRDPEPPGKMRKAFKLFGKRKPGSIFSVRGKAEGNNKPPIARSETADGLKESPETEKEHEKEQEPEVSRAEEEEEAVEEPLGDDGDPHVPSASRPSISSMTSAKSLSFLMKLRRGRRGGPDRRFRTESQPKAPPRRGLKGLFGSMRWNQQEKGASNDSETPPSPLLMSSRTSSVEIIKEDMTLTPRPVPRSMDVPEHGQESPVLSGSPTVQESWSSSGLETTAPSETTGGVTGWKEDVPPPLPTTEPPPLDPPVDRLTSLLADISSLISFDSLTGCGDISAEVEAEWGKASSTVWAGPGTLGEKAPSTTLSSRATPTTQPSPPSFPLLTSTFKPANSSGPSTKPSSAFTTTIKPEPAPTTTTKPSTILSTFTSSTTRSSASPLTKPSPLPTTESSPRTSPFGITSTTSPFTPPFTSTSPFTPPFTSTSTFKPVSTPSPAPVSQPAPVVIPSPVPLSKTAPVVTPSPAPVFTSSPAPVSQPAPVDTPSPAPVCKPAPVVTPSPAPVSKPAPLVTPSLAPVCKPAPGVTPSFAPVCKPAPVVTPSPAPVCQPAPGDTPSPAPECKPAPVVTPSLAPVCNPAPVVTPSPAPVCQPAPAVTPSPAPLSTPVSVATPSSLSSKGTTYFAPVAKPPLKTSPVTLTPAPPTQMSSSLDSTSAPPSLTSCSPTAVPSSAFKIPYIPVPVPTSFASSAPVRKPSTVPADPKSPSAPDSTPVRVSTAPPFPTPAPTAGPKPPPAPCPSSPVLSPTRQTPQDFTSPNGLDVRDARNNSAKREVKRVGAPNQVPPGPPTEKKTPPLKAAGLSKIPVCGGGRSGKLPLRETHTDDEGTWDPPTPGREEEPSPGLRRASSKDTIGDSSPGADSEAGPPSVKHSPDEGRQLRQPAVYGSAARDSKIPVKLGAQSNIPVPHGAKEPPRSKIPLSKVPVRRMANRPTASAAAGVQIRK